MESSAHTRAEKLRVRSLFLVNNLEPREIAKKLDKDPRQVSNLIYRNGWAAQRRAMQERAEANVLARGLGSAEEFVESTAIDAVEMAAKGFEMARATNDPKEFADSMRGTKIAVDMGRQALALDAQSMPGSITINQVFGRPVEKTVTAEPIHEAREVVLDFE